MVTDQQIEADARSFQLDADARRDFWHRSGAMTDKGEFKQHLHLWTMGSKGPGPRSVIQHEYFPWVPLWDKPDLSELSAYWHVAGFDHLPSEWSCFWEGFNGMRGRCMTAGHQGPYWMLLPQMSTAALAQQMTGMKRRIQNQQFLKNQTQSITALDAELISALEPFKVMTPQQEMEDEAVRSREVGRYDVQDRYLAAFSRPPRCG